MNGIAKTLDVSNRNFRALEIDEKLVTQFCR